MTIKNTMKFILSIYLLAQGGHAADLREDTQTVTPKTRNQEEEKKNSSYLPAKETVTGVGLTLGGLYAIFTNKDIPYKYKLGVLGVALGSGIIYMSPQTSSLTKHLYTATGSGVLGLSSGLIIGGLCGTVFGGACVILYCFHDVNKPIPFFSALKSSLTFFSSSEIRKYITEATNTPYSVFTNPGAKVSEPVKQIADTHQ